MPVLSIPFIPLLPRFSLVFFTALGRRLGSLATQVLLVTVTIGPFGPSVAWGAATLNNPNGAIALAATRATLPDSLANPTVPSWERPFRTEGEYRWRLRLDYSFGGYKLDPRVSFYRSAQEVPNQEVIRPETGPEELFLVGTFRAFEAEELNNHYRLALEHRIKGHLWAYGGLRHQRLVYRLDNERTNYTGTDADLLFRGKIRYRETGLEAGLGYRSGRIRQRFSTEFRVGLHYATERARVFDGTLRAREQLADLTFRYREELAPRYRWGYQAEMVTHYHLNERMSLYFTFGALGHSDGVVRIVNGLFGISRQF